MLNCFFFSYSFLVSYLLCKFLKSIVKVRQLVSYWPLSKFISRSKIFQQFFVVVLLSAQSAVRFFPSVASSIWFTIFWGSFSKALCTKEEAGWRMRSFFLGGGLKRPERMKQFSNELVALFSFSFRVRLVLFENSWVLKGESFTATARGSFKSFRPQSGRVYYYTRWWITTVAQLTDSRVSIV